MSEKERIVNKIREDKTRHINFDESFGGSENQFRLLALIIFLSLICY